MGRNSWLTADEQDLFIGGSPSLRGSVPRRRCGSGGPALRSPARTGCAVQGVDTHEQAIAGARSGAARAASATGAIRSA